MDWFQINGTLIAILLAITAIVLLISQNRMRREGFEQPPAIDPTYNARMTVMKVFDAIMSRKPTAAEIEKYSKYENEHDMLDSIMKIAKDPSVVEKMETEPSASATPASDSAFVCASASKMDIIADKAVELLNLINEARASGNIKY